MHAIYAHHRRQVVRSGQRMGRCIFHSNIWIPVRALDDDRDCFVKDNQVVYCQSGLPYQARIKNMRRMHENDENHEENKIKYDKM